MRVLNVWLLLVPLGYNKIHIQSVYSTIKWRLKLGLSRHMHESKYGLKSDSMKVAEKT